MQATKEGIQINRAEIAALLAFVGDEERFSAVQFRVNGSGKLIASATDGKRAVEVTAQVDGAETGEWAIDRTFLEHMRRGCDEGETQALLKVTAKGLRIGIVQGIEDGSERARVTWPTEAANMQTTMDAIRGVIGTDVALSGSWFAVNPSYVKDLAIVAAACDKCPISLFPGAEPSAAVHFEAAAVGGRWRGVIMPIVVKAPGEEALEPVDGDQTAGAGEPAPGSETTPAVGAKPRPAKPLKLEPELATAKKRRPKASKAPKKAKRKR